MKKLLSFNIPKNYSTKKELDSLWKAKHIIKKDECIEIRKTIRGVSLLIVVYKKSNPVEYNHENIDKWYDRHQNVVISMNGKLDLTWSEFFDINEVTKEALEILL